MPAFGLYETLRILLPGSIAVGVFDVALRIIAKTVSTPAGATAKNLADSLDASAFAIASLVAGFLLYAVDFPKRLRIFQEGDPTNKIVRPSDHLKALWLDKPHSASAVSGFFLLTDAHLPPETHRRVYFFGSIYHIYANGRFLAAAGVSLGGAGLVAVSGAPLGVSTRGELPAVLALVMLALIGLAGEAAHRAKAREEGPKGYRNTTWQRLRLISRPAAVTLGLGLGAHILARTAGSQTTRVTLALLLAIGAWSMWFLAEIGPPRANSERTLHYWTMRLLRVDPDPKERAQLIPVARTVMDLALFAPALVGVASVAGHADRPGWVAGLWLVLALPCTLIMAARKHEQRLLSIYADQVAWLDLNAAKISNVGRSGFPAAEWS